MGYSQIRNFLRSGLLDILGYFSHPANGIHILNGHMINRTTANTEDQQRFYDLLNELKHSVNFICIDEAVNLIVHGHDVEHPLIAFTFDDGFMDCFTAIAPVLESFHVNGAFFINPNFVDGDDAYIRHFTESVVLTPGKRPMRWTEIKDLSKRGHIIGAHTMDHYMVNTDNTDELEYQICTCRKTLEEKLNTECDYFAFPYGRLEHANLQAINIACKYYKYVFSQSDYRHYFSFDGRVINRRHFEPFWPISHVKYFLSCYKK